MKFNITKIYEKMIMNKYVNKLRRKLAFLFYNPYIELANLHNEIMIKIYPNLAVFSFLIEFL